MRILSSGITMDSSHTLETISTRKRTSTETLGGERVPVRDSGGNALSHVADRVSRAAVYERTESAVVVLSEQEKMADGVTLRTKQSDTQTGAAEQKASMGEILNGMGSLRMTSACFDMDKYEDLKTSLLRRMLDLLNGRKTGKPLNFGQHTHGYALDFRSSVTLAASHTAQLFSIGRGAGGHAFSMGTTAAGTVWERVTTDSATHTEAENTVFRSHGFAVTEDGRSLQFDVELSMSRSFMSQYDAISSEKYLLTDPLIINLDSDVTSVSDVKFSFDLDSDGKREQISFAGEGSGFLALDANGNGVIDDGSELFGTRSGDGFGDLSAYDMDGNQWIDENDAVYSQLRVWTKDETGQDKLLDLNEANVGAIYLGSVSTQFSLNDAVTNETNAVIRRTGIYLRESGEVGTLSHVDLRR